MMSNSPAPADGPCRFLFAMFQGGGNIPLILPIVGRLVAHGHAVRILAGPGIRASRTPVSDRFRDRIAAVGATLVPFAEPAVHPLDAAPPPRGLVRGWIPDRLAALTLQVPTLVWSPAWAANVAAALRRAPTAVLVADHFLPGALVAAEAAGVPAAVLVHTFYLHRPAPGLPAYGTGCFPARGLRDRLRDTLANAAVEHTFRRDGLPHLNRARRQLGRAPLRSPFEQYDRAARVLILASAALDFPARHLPANVRYVGTPFDDVGAAAWASPWPVADPRPLVLVSLSTLPQGQAPVLQRILAALASLPVRALVTLGPALDPAHFQAPPNAVLETFVPHAAVLPQVAAMVTQCGLGATMKALAHGVPLVCIPLLGDQPANAARVVARGAGVRLAADATPDRIRLALRRVLDSPRYRAGARRLATLLAGADGAETAARELESLGQAAQRHRRASAAR
jgi:UDP:flavonoid glycosyltransferase YjiC (YdhE family)